LSHGLKRHCQAYFVDASNQPCAKPYHRVAFPIHSRSVWDNTHSRKILCVVHLNFRKSFVSNKLVSISFTRTRFSLTWAASAAETLGLRKRGGANVTCDCHVARASSLTSDFRPLQRRQASASITDFVRAWTDLSFHLRPEYLN